MHQRSDVRRQTAAAGNPIAIADQVRDVTPEDHRVDAEPRRKARRDDVPEDVAACRWDEPEAVFGRRAPHHGDDDVRPGADIDEERAAAERSAQHIANEAPVAERIPDIEPQPFVFDVVCRHTPRFRQASTTSRPARQAKMQSPRTGRSIPIRTRVSSNPPISGAIIGATAMALAIRLIICAERSRPNRSRMMARPDRQRRSRRRLPGETHAQSDRAAFDISDRAEACAGRECKSAQDHRAPAETVGQGPAQSCASARPSHVDRDRELDRFLVARQALRRAAVPPAPEY